MLLFVQMENRRLVKTLLLGATAVLVAASLALAGGRATSPTAGVVVVNTRLAYGGSGAGTGIVLTSSGEVLTNNHVIRGASAIRVTVPSTGRTYTATVAGYNVTRDIALLRLRAAHGLQIAVTGNSASVRVGGRVTAVGNARGAGLSTKTGTVTGVHQGITITDENGTSRLTGLIKTNAALEPGDSGGPLLSAGRVVGIDAAASRSFSFRGSGDGYAIPINLALSIVRQIESGRQTQTVHIGATAFLGVAVTDPETLGQTSHGAVVQQVASGSPADHAGIGQADVITVFGGKRVTSAAKLKTMILQLRPGSTVRVTWIDSFEGSTSASVRLATGPPQ